MPQPAAGNTKNEPDPGFVGKLFELNLYLLFLHQGCRNKYRFKLLREQKDAGKFDDLVFELEENGAKVHKLYQVKHTTKPETKTINDDHFFAGMKGEFDLIKYFLSYRTAKTKYGQITAFVICTNFSFNLKLKTSIEPSKEHDTILDIEKNNGKKPERFHISATDENINEFKKNWEIRKEQWKDEAKRDTRKNALASQPDPSDKELKAYLNALTFAVDMPSNEELSTIIENEIGKGFNQMTREEIYNRAFRRMVDWMDGKDTRNFWTHDDAKALLEDIKTGFTLPYDVWSEDVQPPVNLFIGRSKQLTDMHELLQKDNKEVMVCGIGGVGKTELVRKYIKDYSETYYNNIVWINAENDEAFAKSFQNFAENELGIDSKNVKSLKTLIRMVYQWFKQSKSLFIFDNAQWHQYQNFMRSSLSKNVRKPYIIVTSQIKWGNESVIERIDLSEFTAVEATNFISKSLPKFLENGRQGDSVEKLAETLQFFPLALRQAVAYVSAKFKHKTDTYLLSEYIDNFSRKSVDYLDYDLSKYCESKYNKTVWTTWNVTLETLRSEKNYAPDVLNFLSFLLPDFIHAELLSKLFNEEDKLKDTILLLDEYSLITVRKEVYSLHRLVQLVTREKLKRDKKDRKILEQILGATEDNDECIDRSVDHFTCAWKYLKESCKELKKYYQIPVTIALILFRGSRYTEAYSLGAEALKLMHSLSLKDKEEQQFLQEIAPIFVKILCSSGDNEEALDKSKKILKIFEDMHEQIDCPVPIVLIENEILFIHLRMADFEAAYKVWNESFFKQEFPLLRKYRLRYNDIELVWIENQLDIMNLKFHGFNEVVSDFRSLFDHRKSTLGVEHPSILRMIKKTAYVFSEIHLYERATNYNFSINKRTEFVNELLSILLTAYEKQKINLPKMHNDRLDTQESIINLRIELGEYEEALESLNEVSKSRLERNNCYMFTMKAAVLALLEKKDRALAICENLDRGTATLKSDVKRHHCLDIFDRRLRIALVKSLLGELNDALDILKEIWNGVRIYISFNKVYLINVLKVIGLLYWKENQYTQALNALEEAWQHYKPHKSTLSDDLDIFVQKFHEKGQIDRALQHGLKLLENFKYTAERAGIFRLLNRIALLYKDKKDFKEALKMLTGMKKSLENWSEENSPDCLKICNEISEVKKLYTEALREMQSTATTKDTFVAIKTGNLGQLKKLIEGGGNVNQKDEQKWTLLHRAADLDEPELVEYLLAKGADVNAVTEEKKKTALHIAVAKNRIGVVRKILEFNSDMSKKLLNAITKPSGNTALHIASREGFLEIVKLLLCNGACYEVKNKAGETPLHLAKDIIVRAVLLDVERCFKSVSCDGSTLGPINNYSALQYMTVVGARDLQHNNLLQLAVLNGRKEDVEEILSFKIQYSAVKYEADWLLAVDTEVSNIRRNSEISLVEYLNLLNLIEKRVRERCTCMLLSMIMDILILLAAEKLRSDESRKFAKHVIDIQLEKFMALLYGSALIVAAKRNDLNLFKLCLDKQPNLDLRDENGMSFLYFAIDSGNEVMVKLLLEKNVSCLLTGQIVTLLHLAAKKGYVEIVELFLQCHWSSVLVNYIEMASKLTPLHCAAKYGHIEVVKLLLEHSACYDMKDINGRTPADLTEKQEIKDLFKRIDELHVESDVARVVERLKNVEPAERRPLLNAYSVRGTRIRNLIANHKDKKDFLNVLGLENEVEQDNVLQMKSSIELREILLEIAEKFKDSSC